MIGGALAGIPTVLFAAAHSLTAGIITLIVFVIYTQVENHILNPVIMSRTVKVNPLLVLLSILVGASIGSWIGGIFGAFVAALLSIPAAGAIQVLVREIWLSTAPKSADPLTAIQRAAPEPPGSAQPAHSGPAGPGHAGPDHTGPAEQPARPH
jgi:predicted PurR-regulated permease PerM